MRVFDENRNVVILIEFADLVGLLLSEKQAAILSSDDAISVVRTLPCDGPFRPRLNHSGDFRHINLAKLSRGDHHGTKEQKQCEKRALKSHGRPPLVIPSLGIS